MRLLCANSHTDSLIVFHLFHLAVLLQKNIIRFNGRESLSIKAITNGENMSVCVVIPANLTSGKEFKRSVNTKIQQK